MSHNQDKDEEDAISTLNCLAQAGSFTEEIEDSSNNGNIEGKIFELKFMS